MLEKLEKKYGIKIVDDSYWNPLQQKYLKRYRVYAADGCEWENNMTWKRLLAMLREDADRLIEIKKMVEETGYEADILAFED